MKKIVVIIPLFFIIIVQVFSQAHDGGEPFGKKWQEINTNDFRIIYDEGMDSIAQNMSRLFHYMHDYNDRSIGAIKRKLNIVLHNETSVVNSMLMYTPYHCELFVSPSPQNTIYWGPDDWNITTPIHEYRHALQFSNASYGFGEYFRILFGDGVFLFRGVLVPRWHTEGDAVVQETALTNGGRGRLPAFSEAQRAMIFNNVDFPYSKWKNGSYIDETNNYYALGYQMALYARNQFGNDSWKNVLQRSYQLKSFIYPFSSNLKTLYGINTKTLYKKSYADLKARYEHLLDSIGYVDNEILYPKIGQKYPTFYRQPLYDNEGKLFAVRVSWNQNPKIVEIANGEEIPVCVLGRMQDDKYFDQHNGKFIWSERVNSVRRGYVNYMQLVEYDSKTNKRRYLTLKSNAQSPSYSSDGGQVVYVESNKFLEKYLVIIDAENGEELKRIRTSFKPIFPRFLDNDKALIYTGTENGKAFLGVYHLENGIFDRLTIDTPYAIGKPVVDGDKVYFTASFNGINNVYVYEFKGGDVHQVTSAKIGLQEPAVVPNEDALIVSERVFSKGQNLTKVDLSKGFFKQDITILPERNNEQDSALYALREIKKEGGSIADKLSRTVYPTSKYQKGKHLIHPYYWSLLYDNEQVGAVVSFRNILSTLFVNAVYQYDYNKETGSAQGYFTYYGFYPILRGEWNQLFHKNFLTYDPEAGTKFYEWNEQVLSGKATIPFDFSRHQFHRKIQLAAKYAYSNIDFSDAISVPDYNLHSLTFQFYGVNSRLKSYAQLQPKYSQSFEVVYSKSLSDQSNQLYMHSILKFPGLTPTNSLGLEGSFEVRKIGDLNYVFSDYFSNSRGYHDAREFDSQYKLSINYEHPVWYPDLGIHGLFYFNRLRANYFCDYTNVIANNSNTNYSSAGIELKLDGTFYDQIPFVLGAGVSYLINPVIGGKCFYFSWHFYY